MRRVILAAVLGVVALALPAGASASFHLMKITEVGNANPADYVELQINDAAAPGSLHLCEAIQTFLQLPAGGEPGGCGASTYGDEYQLSVDATYALDLPTTKAQVEAAMAAVGFAVDATAADETITSFEGNGVDGTLSYYSADGTETDLTAFVYVPVG